MIKEEYLQHIKNLCNIPKYEIDIIITAFINLMKENLVRKKQINIANFGTFTLNKFQPERIFSPVDGKAYSNKNIYKVYFRQSQDLKEYIKKGLE